jgi:hypothetical protein
MRVVYQGCVVRILSLVCLLVLIISVSKVPTYLSYVTYLAAVTFHLIHTTFLYLSVLEFLGCRLFCIVFFCFVSYFYVGVFSYSSDGSRFFSYVSECCQFLFLYYVGCFVFVLFCSVLFFV